MNCPKCGEPINEYQHFCSNCGNNLDNKVQLFQQHKKAAKKAFLSTCKDANGERDGCGKLGQAAWFIATNTEANFDYLQGEKMGCAESYDLLKAAVKEAKNVFQTLHFLSDLYRKGFPIPIVRRMEIPFSISETTAQADSSAHVLRGLVSYHERMTMGDYPERDFYLDALRFALSCVEEKIS